MSDNAIDIRSMRDDECVLWGALRTKLWPDCLEAENQEEYAALRVGMSAIQIVFLAFSGENAIGFAEISERSVVDSCGNKPAAYLEGWFVEPTFQKRGIGTMLVQAAVDWARRKGYEFLGSDVEPENLISQKAHEQLGFIETGRSVNYHMKLRS